MLDRVAQSLRAAGGTEFEYIVARILNTFLESDGIVVTRARAPALRALIGDPSLWQGIMDFTRVPVKRRCDQRQLVDYPDLDLFALIRPERCRDQWRLLAILNCKVSFHARETEATFWGLLIRLTSHIPFVMVTEDRNVYQPGGRSELGDSCQNSTRTRRLLESFTDGVYVVKRYDSSDAPQLVEDIERKRQLIATGQGNIVFDSPGIPTHTQYCPAVRPMDELIIHLRRWKEEIIL